MKQLLLSFCIFLSFTAFSQNQVLQQICTDIECYEKGHDPIYYKDITEEELYEKFAVELDLYNPSSNKEALKEDLAEVLNYNQIYKLRRHFEEHVFKKKLDRSIGGDIYGLETNLRILDNRVSEILEGSFQNYGFSETSDQWIKSFHIYHDNDVFLFSDLNVDRDYTGGVRIEVTTDKLKMRLFKRINSDKFLSYQSLIFGGEGYTPYIRFDESTFEILDVEPVYVNGFLSDDSRNELSSKLSELQEPTDRPFASFQYLARAKYRLHYKGLFRSASYFKIGTVGGKIGERLQQVLHQDVTTNSVRVLNWDRQVANGGRLGFNIEHNFDFLLYSQYQNVFDTNQEQSNYLSNRLHIYLPTEIAFGNVHTYIGGGLGVSNKSFLQTNSQFELQYKREFTDCDISDKDFCDLLKCVGNRIWQHTYIGAEYRVRRVYHNAMLNGLGFFNKFNDDPFDDENPSVYVLTDQQTTDWLHRLNITLSLRLRRASIYYRYTRFLNKEFNVESSVPEPNLYTTPKQYGYGTFGLVIKI